MAAEEGENARVLVVKIEAARRQLDAAIRMLLSDEDELAIHTVAAAAHSILRDLGAKRRGSNLTLTLGLGMYLFARDLAEGTIDALPEDVDDETARFIRQIADDFRVNGVRPWNEGEFRIGKRAEDLHWRKINAPANFLKHADRDASGLMPLDKFDPIGAILSAGLIYVDLMKRSTPEMRAFHIFQAAYSGVTHGMSEPYLSLAKELLGQDRRRIAKRCFEMIDSLKDECLFPV